MFKSIRSKSALFLGLLLIGSIAQANTITSLDGYVVDPDGIAEPGVITELAFFSLTKENPYNPFTIKIEDLKKKLRNRKETKKIVLALCSDQECDSYFQNVIDSNSRLTTICLSLGWDCPGPRCEYLISKESFLNRRSMLLNNKWFIKDLAEELINRNIQADFNEHHNKTVWLPCCPNYLLRYPAFTDATIQYLIKQIKQEIKLPRHESWQQGNLGQHFMYNLSGIIWGLEEDHNQKALTKLAQELDSVIADASSLLIATLKERPKMILRLSPESQQIINAHCS